MPGDELIRSNYEEEGLIENKVDYELNELPSGGYAKTPKDYIKIKMVNGRLEKEKGNVATRLYHGCSHVRLSPEKEDALVLQAGARGVKVRCKGRLGGAEIARSETLHQGQMPLHKIRANIDYGLVEAHTIMGRIGVKVWIYKGDIMPEVKEKSATAETSEVSQGT